MECFAVFKVREHWNLKFQEACPSQAPGTVLLPCGLSPRAVSQSPIDANLWPLRSLLLLRTAFASWGACAGTNPPPLWRLASPRRRQTGLHPDCLQARPANCL